MTDVATIPFGRLGQARDVNTNAAKDIESESSAARWRWPSMWRRGYDDDDDELELALVASEVELELEPESCGCLCGGFTPHEPLSVSRKGTVLAAYKYVGSYLPETGTRIVSQVSRLRKKRAMFQSYEA